MCVLLAILLFSSVPGVKAEIVCSNHGERVDGECSCDVGYTGSNCGMLQDLCKGKACGEEEHRGRCAPDDGQCYCRDGWFGEQCGISTCSFNGIYDTDHGVCRCFTGFEGQACESCEKAPEGKVFVCLGMPDENNDQLRTRGGWMIDDTDENSNSRYSKLYGSHTWSLLIVNEATVESFLEGHTLPSVLNAPAPVLPDTKTDDGLAFFDCACNPTPAHLAPRDIDVFEEKARAAIAANPSAFPLRARDLEERELTKTQCTGVLATFAAKNHKSFVPASATVASATSLLEDVVDNSMRCSWFEVVLIAFLVSIGAILLVSILIFGALYDTMTPRELLSRVQGLGAATLKRRVE